MIILSPSDLPDKAAKLNAPVRLSPPPTPPLPYEDPGPHSARSMPSISSLRSLPPPVHPAMQYGVAAPSPPTYQTTRRPFAAITYVFRPDPSRWNSMILEPPDDLAGPYPSYHITVNMNCFTPTSFITTIRRGTEGDGELVGDFEIGVTTGRKSHTVFIRENEHLLSDVMKSGHHLFRNYSYWKTMNRDKPVTLYWDDSSSLEFQCFSSKDRTNSTVIARFIPPPRLRKAGRATEMNRLEVSPQGHDLFDDILMSALILERLRTTPCG